jgi:hypothetical protein
VGTFHALTDPVGASTTSDPSGASSILGTTTGAGADSDASTPSADVGQDVVVLSLRLTASPKGTRPYPRGRGLWGESDE